MVFPGTAICRVIERWLLFKTSCFSFIFQFTVFSFIYFFSLAKKRGGWYDSPAPPPSTRPLKKYMKCQRGGFLNRYHFAYAGTDTVNQAMKDLDALAPKIIKQATGWVNQIAQRRILQIINQRRQQVEKIALKIGCNRRGM